MKTSLVLIALFLVIPSSWARPQAATQVLSRVTEVKSEGGTPVVVMDLDETVVDSSPRKLQSYQSAVQQLCGQDRAGDCGRVAGMNISEVLALPDFITTRPFCQ